MFYPAFPAKVEFPDEEIGAGFVPSALERFKHSVCKTLVINLFARGWMNAECFAGEKAPAGGWVLSAWEPRNFFLFSAVLGRPR